MVSDLVIVYSQLDPLDGPVGPPHISCSDCLDTGGGVQAMQRQVEGRSVDTGCSSLTDKMCIGQSGTNSRRTGGRGLSRAVLR